MAASRPLLCVDEPPVAPGIPEFPDVVAFVEILNRHGVRYVVISVGCLCAVMIV